MTRAHVSLLLVDDHPIARLGLTRLFEATPGFSVVGEAGSVAQAVAESRRLRPDVVVLDVRLPDGSGIDGCRAIRAACPDTRVVMFSANADEDAIIAAIAAGAAGYLLKSVQLRELVQAVEAVARGASLLDPAVVATVVRWIQRLGEAAATDPLARAGLSQQERHILPLIAEGRTNREIAEALSLSERTVKTYVSHILRKLHLARRSEAAAFIARRNPIGT